MFWLARRIVVVCLLMCTLIGSTVLYSRTHAGPNPLHAYGLDTCDGKPCFMGITPGVTSWAQARLMRPTGAKQDEYARSFVVPIAGTQVGIIMSLDPAKVAIIDAATLSDNQFPRLASFLTQFGTPCGVAAGYAPGEVTLHYPSMMLNVDVQTLNRLTAYAPVATIDLIDPNVAFGVAQDLCKYLRHDRIVIPWLGFASLDHYRAYGLPQ